MPVHARAYLEKFPVVQAAIKRMQNATDAEALDLLWWEMGLLRFSPAPRDDGNLYCGQTYEQFAASFGMTDATASYALDRAAETSNIVLRLHYLSFVLDRMPATGKAWVERQREVLALWRQYADYCRAAAPTDTECNAAMCIEDALDAAAPMMSRAGVLRADEPADWASWLLQLATEVRTFPGCKEEREEFWQHRWVAPFLRHLKFLSADSANTMIRAQAFSLLDDAGKYYASEPLSDTFSYLVAEVRYELRLHWGDTNAHPDKIRDQFATIVRRANLHKATGNGMLTQHFFREARRLADEHRQYFTNESIDELMLEERAAIQHSVVAGEFKTVSASVELPKEHFERVRDTPESTIDCLVADVAVPIPTRASLEAAVKGIADVAPLQMMFATTIFGAGKVVGESNGEHYEEKNVDLAIEQQALVHARLAGYAMSATIVAAASKVGVTVEHLIAPLSSLHADAGTIELIRHGCERLIAEDFVSACHVLVPRVEDVLRQELRARGLHATEFKRDVGDGTSRTDDEPLGSMLARTLPDGTKVREFLGEDFAQRIEWTMASQTGLNLRNTFAHGQARPGHCTAENAGIVLAILYRLAVLVA